MQTLYTINCVRTQFFSCYFFSFGITVKISCSALKVGVKGVHVAIKISLQPSLTPLPYPSLKGCRKPGDSRVKLDF